MHVGDARPRRNWWKQPRRDERDPDKPQASCTQTSASGRGVRRDDLREDHRANAEAAERQRHQPAVAAQLVFADEVSRVELWLEAMQEGKEAQERGHQPEGQARPNQGGLPLHSFRVAQFGCYVLFEGQDSRGRRNEVDAAGFSPHPARAYTGPDSHYGSPVGRPGNGHRPAAAIAASAPRLQPSRSERGLDPAPRGSLALPCDEVPYPGQK
jgi:hypothetical protein